MAIEHICTMIQYGYHISATRDTAFVHTELATKNAMGHIIVWPWDDVRQLLVLWIITLGLIHQDVQRL